MGETALILHNRPFLGALLVHMPLLRGLRERHPDSRVVAYSPFDLAGLLVDEGMADEVVTYHGTRSLWTALRRRRPDRIYCLRRKSLRVALAVATCGISDTTGYQYRQQNRYYRVAVPHDRTVYRARAFLDLLQLSDAEAHAHVVGAIDQLAGRAPAKSIAGNRYTIVPCCSDDRKQWGLDRFLAWCRHWREHDGDATFAAVLGPREAPMADAIRASDLGDRFAVLTSPSLPQLAHAVRGSRVTISNDCAPGHLAQMSGAPSVTIFGNWDGEVGRRTGEWFYDRPGARCLTTERASPIADISVATAVDATTEILSVGPLAGQ